LPTPENYAIFPPIRIFWFVFVGFIIGALAVFFAFNPTLLNPQTFLAAATDFFRNSHAHKPAYYLRWIYSLGVIALVATGATIALLAWITRLEKTVLSQNESIYELRSQISALLSDHKKN